MFLAAFKNFSCALMGYGVNGRNLHVCPSDIFLVGYPKSGNTWLNFMIACLLSERAEDINFESIEWYVADIYFNDASALHKLPNPRFLKSHEPLDSRYPKVIYIVRDPRAVAISYYHHLIGLGKVSEMLPLEHFVPKFIHGDLDAFGSWEKHVCGWLDLSQKMPDRVMIVKYEDLKSGTSQVLLNIVKFLGLNAGEQKIQDAIAWSSFENMRRLEIDARRKNFNGFFGFREGSFFVRQANSLSWKNELEESLKNQIEKAWIKVMQDLGYC